MPRGPGRKPGSSFLKLNPQRKVSSDPRKLEEFPLCKHEGYRRQYAYVIFISRKVVKEENGKKKEKWVPIDARIVKTLPTLNRIAEQVQEKGLRVLLHPQPVKIPTSFWEQWRKIKNGKERIELAKSLVKDKNIFILVCVVLDWDSPYEECEPVFLELVERLGIQGYEMGKTKSGNFRAVIYLEPLRIEKEGKPIASFYLSPHAQAKNGHSHIENFKELISIINAYARKLGIKADDSFKRVNHPVWYGKTFYTRLKKIRGETKLYELYNAVKRLQAEEGLWEVNKEFWQEKYKEKQVRGKVVVPPFIARMQVNGLGDLCKWQIAVKRLAEAHTYNRFRRVILPAVGWAMDLGLSRCDVDAYLKDVLPDKRDMDDELERAWKYGKPTQFKWGGRSDIDVKEKIIDFLSEVEGGSPRQFLLSEVFGGHNWLLQLVEKFALKEGLISLEKKKLTPGPGRKSYVYTLTEKGRSFLEALKHNDQEIQLSVAVGYDMSNPKKSNIQLLSFGEKQEGLPSGLVVGGYKSKRVCVEDSVNDEGMRGGVSGAGGSVSFLPCCETSCWFNGELSPEESLGGGLSFRVFSDKGEAVEFLEGLNGRYKIGDRVRVWVVSPARMHGGKSVLYEFEKVRVKVFRGFEEVGERETWELKRIHWESLSCSPPREGGKRRKGAVGTKLSRVGTEGKRDREGKELRGSFFKELKKCRDDLQRVDMSKDDLRQRNRESKVVAYLQGIVNRLGIGRILEMIDRYNEDRKSLSDLERFVIEVNLKSRIRRHKDREAWEMFFPDEEM